MSEQEFCLLIEKLYGLLELAASSADAKFRKGVATAIREEVLEKLQELELPSQVHAMISTIDAALVSGELDKAMAAIDELFPPVYPN